MQPRWYILYFTYIHTSNKQFGLVRHGTRTIVLELNNKTYIIVMEVS